MCHLLLAVPALGLGLFLFLPFKQALPIYIPTAALSLYVYYLVIKAMRMPQRTGMESLVGGIAEVVSPSRSAEQAQYVVRYRGELWGAISEHRLSPGERVRIISHQGIRVVVQRIRKRRAP